MHKNAEPITNKPYLYMLSKCGKHKNPCKICFQSVTKKNGLQCRGACKKWAHYNCLGYTPGKIRDIKAGHITIVCPCPDCSTEPKEILMNPPINCPEVFCPANNFPKCESNECPKNKCVASFPSSFPCECVNPTVPKVDSCVKPPSKYVYVRNTPPCPSPQKTCKEMTVQKSKSCSCSLAGSHTECKPVTDSCYKPVICKPVKNCKPVQAPQQCSGSSSSDSQLCNKERDMSGSMINALEQMCQTVTQLSDQIKLIMCKLLAK